MSNIKPAKPDTLAPGQKYRVGWEYSSTQSSTERDDEGRAGWEVYGVTIDGGVTTWHMKRQRYFPEPGPPA
jgi:hypothetical protein